MHRSPWHFHLTIDDLNNQLAPWQQFQAEVAACTYKELRSTAQLLTLLSRQQALKYAAHEFIIVRLQMRPLYSFLIEHEREYVVKIAEICAYLQRLTQYFANMHQSLHLHALHARELPAPSFNIVLELMANVQEVHDWVAEQLQQNLMAIRRHYPAQHPAISALVDAILHPA